MNYIKKVKSSISFKNFKKGFDETTLYGPLCIIFAIALVILFSLNIINLESLVLALIVICYIFFFYFPLHNSKIILVGFLIVMGPLIILGLFSLIFGNISFLEIKALSIVWWIYCALTLLFVILSSIRRSLKESDKWSSVAYELGGKFLVILSIILAPFGFLAIEGSYRLFGKEHLLAWIIIFIFWGISNLRLLIYKIIKKSASHTA